MFSFIGLGWTGLKYATESLLLVISGYIQTILIKVDWVTMNGKLMYM